MCSVTKLYYSWTFQDVRRLVSFKMVHSTRWVLKELNQPFHWSVYMHSVVYTYQLIKWYFKFTGLNIKILYCHHVSRLIVSILKTFQIIMAWYLEWWISCRHHTEGCKYKQTTNDHHADVLVKNTFTLNSISFPLISEVRTVAMLTLSVIRN